MGMFNKKEPWQIAAARWCVDHSEEFSHDELKNFILQKYKVKDLHIEYFIQQEILRPPGRQSNREQVKGTSTLPLDLVSKVTDYDELREARRNSRWAFFFAVCSLIVALVTLYVTASS